MRINRLLIFCALFVFGFSFSAFAQVKIIETVAGTGTTTYNGDGMPATATNLNTPYGYALNAAGTRLYYADQGLNRVRMLNLNTGIITTVAGSGTAGSAGDGSPATAATVQLNGPTNVAIDAANNLYIVEAAGNRIRKITAATGIISTIAGTGVPGFTGDGAAATAATLSNPRGIAVDAAGNVFFSDPGPGFGAGYNHIRKITAATSFISTIAGNGLAGGYAGDGAAATGARLNNPRGVVLDATGNNLYFADMGNNRVRRIDLVGGNIYLYAGNGTGGFAGDGTMATAAGTQINAASGVNFDNLGNLIISDANNNRIRMVTTSTGIISTIAGTGLAAGYAGDGTPATSATVKLNGPSNVAFTSWGSYYIYDRSNGRIRIVRNNSTPYFTGGSHQTMTSVCQNSTAVSINPYLNVTDTDLHQTLTWSLVATSPNGTLTGFPPTSIATTGGSVITATALTYQPNPGFSGNDSFIVQVTDGYATSNDTVVITVNPLPVVAAISGSNTVCESGGTLTLSDATAGGVWSSSTAKATISVGGVVTGITAGTTTISYSYTSVFGCGPVVATYGVTVNPLPNAGSISGPASVCISSTCTLVDGVPGGVWTSSTTTIATISALGVVSPVAAGSDIIKYTVTNFCGSSFASFPLSVVSLPLLTPSVSISPGKYGDTVCSGQTITFTPAPKNGGASPSYDWYLNGSYVYSGATYSPTLYYPGDSGDVISCRMTSNYVCVSVDTAHSNSITMSVDNSTQIPTINVVASPGSVACASNPVTFTASITYGGLTPLIRWTKNGINVATGYTYTYLPVSGDKIHSMLASSSGCLLSPAFDSIFTTDISMSVLTVLLPHVTISSTAGTTVGAGMDLVLTANVTHPTISLTYQWLINGVAVPGATTANFTFNQAAAGTTIVNCIVTSGDVCNYTSISNLINLTITSLGVTQAGSDGNTIKLMPNPNRGAFTVEGTLSSDSKEVTLEIMDIVGQVVYRDGADVQNGALNKQVIMANELANGIYMLHIISGDEHKVIRFSISR